MFKFKKGIKGIGLIEVIFGLAIITLLLTIVFKPFTATITRQDLKGAVSDIENLLQEARVKTMSGTDSAEYGVRFEEDRVILFKSPYSSDDPDNQILFLDKAVHITGIDYGYEIIFEHLTGTTEDAGNITVSTVAEPVKSMVISVYASGGFLSN